MPILLNIVSYFAHMSAVPGKDDVALLSGFSPLFLKIDKFYLWHIGSATGNKSDKFCLSINYFTLVGV
jgi:hypothetical protein